MKHYLISILIACLVASAASARSFDNFTRVVLNAPHQRAQLRADQQDDLYYPLVFEINDDGAIDLLHDAGAVIFYRRANFVLAAVPRNAIDVIYDSSFVDVAALSRPTAVTNDVARDFANVNAVHSGKDGIIAYDGAGVITGICDVGFDPTHIAFKDKLAMFSIYDEYSAKRTVYAPGSALQTVADLPATDTADETHGTHTSNIMAGGRDNNPYYGAAPASTLAVSTSSLSDMALLCGVEDIVAFAKEQDKPAVINLSVGSYLGPHDGTDLVNRYLDLLGKEAILCFSAGNYGHRRCCLQYDCTEGNTQFGSMIDNCVTWLGLDIKGYMDFWSSDSQNYEMQFVAYDRLDKKYIYESEWFGGDNANQQFSLQRGDNDAWDAAFTEDSYMVASCGIDDHNNRYNITIGYQINPTETIDDRSARYVCGWRIRGKVGQHIDAYSDGIYSFFRHFAPDMLDGNSYCSISNLCCNRNVVSVGSCNSRNVVPVVDGDDFSYSFDTDIVSPWSAYGTTINGLKLPTICAPGNMIVSAESADYHSSHPDEYTDAYQTTVNGNTYYWIPWCGTSMSSPLVAGIIALWLQAEPTLTVDQAIEVMQRTARTDFADIEDARWGAGCIDAFAGLKYLLNDGVSDVSTSPAAITVVGRRIVSTAPLTIFDTQGRVYDADSELAPGIYIARTPLTTRKLLLP